ncbi:hypothetical protein FH620_32635 [Corallococcus exiguus]|nr:hypothetical protein FH620_32635 [Corallococcus exiguus]
MAAPEAASGDSESGTAIEWSIGPMKLGTVTRLTNLAGTRREEMVINRALRDGVEGLLHGAPALASSAGQMLTNNYTLRFTAEASKGLVDGSLKMMPSKLGGIRANVINEKGRVVSQASLDAVSKAGAVTLAVWQGLAIITAQKFLADIDKRLASIERGISDLKEWLEQERLGGLQGSLTYLKQLAEAVHRSDLTEADIFAFAGQIESIEREAQQTMASLEPPLDQYFVEAQRMNLTGRGLKEHSAAAQGQALVFERRAKEFHLAAFVRGAAIQVRSALPLTQEVARLRLDGLGADLQRQAERQQDFLQLLSRRVPELQGAWSWDSTDAEHQQALRGLLNQVERNLSESTSLVNEAVRTLKERFGEELKQGSEPLELVATLDGTGALVRLERVFQED